jgi:chloramphenicol 3-O phosphotransferase
VIYKEEAMKMKQGLIVLLNGTSSSGKTTIATECINQKEIPFHHLSIDHFFNGLFHDYIDFINLACSSNESANEEDGQAPNHLIIDPLVTLFYSTIKYMSAIGINVMVDTVNDNEERLNTCLGLLMNHPVLFVGVTCSKEELIKREERRGDREKGLAISQYDFVYRHKEYDIELNTESLRPHECANTILSFIRSNRAYSAFEKLEVRKTQH